MTDTASRPVIAEIDQLRLYRNFVAARALAENELARNQEDPLALFALGRIEFDRPDYESALNWFDHSASVGYSTALAWKIAALCRLHRIEEASNVANHAEYSFPDSVDILVAIGRLHLDRYDSSGGVRVFQQALEIDPQNVDALSWRVKTLRMLRRFDDAEEAAARAIEMRPDHPAIVNAMALVHYFQNNYLVALDWFEKALQVDALDATALEWRVTCLRALRRFDDAEGAAARAIEVRPDQPAIVNEMARVHCSRYDYSVALDWFEKALQVDPGNATALEWRVTCLRALRRFDDAEGAAARAIEVRPDQPAIVNEMAWVHCSRYDYSVALDWFEKALQVDPGNATALEWRVTCLRMLRRFDDAEEAAARAIEVRPDQPAIVNEMARVHSNRYDYSVALEWSEKALQIDPRNATTLGWRIACMRALRRFDDAEEAAARAIEVRPDQPAIVNEMAWVHCFQNNYPVALDWFEKTLQVDALDATALEWRVTCLRALRRFDDAEEAAARAIEVRPDQPAIVNEMAWVHCNRYDYSVALDWFEKALQIDPGNATALKWRVACLRMLRRFDDAEEAAARAIEVRPDQPAIVNAMALVHCSRYDYSVALDWFEKALQVDALDATALEWRVTCLRALRRFDDAEEAAARAIEVRPDQPDILNEMALVRYFQDDYLVALDWFEKALQIDPGNATALEWRVTCLRALRRFDDAEEAAARAIEVRPDQPAIVNAMALVHYFQDDYPVALDWFEKTLQVDALDVTALEWRVTCLRMLRRFDDAEEAAARAIEVRPDQPDILNEMAWVHSNRYDYSIALEWFEKTLQIDPRNATALEWRVAMHRRSGNLEDAEASASDGILRRPDVLGLLVEMGYVFDARLQFDEALQWFDRALRIDPGYEEAITAWSATMRSLRRFDEAERFVTAAAKRLPRLRDLSAELVWIYHDSRRFDEAQQVVNLLLADSRSNRERAQASAQLGWLRFAEGKYQLAEQHLRAAALDLPDDLDTHIGLAWSLVRQASPVTWDEAERTCFIVLGFNGRNHSAHTCLGVLNFQRGRYAQAEQHLKKAIDLEPYLGSYVDLGALYSHLGRLDEAERCLEKAIDRDWYDAQAHVEMGHLHSLRDLDDPDGGHSAVALRHFRHALHTDPLHGGASLGLALTLTRLVGDYVEAERVLHQALNRPDLDLPRWQLLLAVAKLLIERGDAAQSSQFYTDALAKASEAISLAANEAEPYFVAAVARYKLAETAGNLSARPLPRRQAARDLRRAVTLDPGNVEAQRSLRILQDSLRVTRNSATGSFIVVGLGLTGLAALWTALFLTTKITDVMLMTLTPILVALVVLGLLLPLLIRLKLPGGVEADLSASIRQISSGPTGEETFGPGRFNVTTPTTGPRGQIPRR